MNYQFRPFSGTDEDYNAIVAVHSVCWPKDPTTVEDTKFYDSQKNPDHLFGRHVCLHEGQIVGYGNYILAFWFPTPNQFRVGWSILPEHEEAATPLFLAYLKAQLAPHNPQGYLSFSQEDKLIKNRVLEADGFNITQRNPRSQLDVASFDGANYEPLRAKLEAAGFEFITLTAYKERDPDWIVTYEEADWQMVKDVPSSEPLVREPLSEYKKHFSSPNHNPDGHIFALKENEIIGISHVSINAVTKEKVYTGFTGVKRPYRRKGIATALKVEIIKFAQAYGATIIETNNEESNPMYTLNLQLGFEPLPAELEYKRPA